MDIREHNRRAWDREVERGNRWTQPVSPQEIAAARRGELSLLLTPKIPVPARWYPPLKGAQVLCLASGGGQQGPLLAAAGAQVTVLDNSPRQLDRDREVAQREGLDIRLVEGDMRDLSIFPDESFDLIFHPISNLFVPEVRPVWREAYRVLRPGGVLLAGFNNPVLYIFDYDVELRESKLEVRYALPYADAQDLPAGQLAQRIADEEALEYGHTLDDQIGGQLDAGFLLSGFYEDYFDQSLLSKFMPVMIATRAVKPLKSS